MFDNFNFDLVSDFLGYVSSKDKTNVNPGVLVRGSQNVYKKLSGTIASRPGRLRRGAVNDTVAGIVSSYVWKTVLGSIRPLRVVDNTSAGGDARLQVESSITGTPLWYDLLTALPLTRYVFDTYFDTFNATDRLIMVRGDSNIQDWGGGITQVAGGNNIQISDAVSTITVSDGGGSYSNFDIVTIIGGDNTATAKVMTTTAGVVTSVLLLTKGSGYSNGTVGTSTVGNGHNLTLTITTDNLTGTITKLDQTKTWVQEGFLSSTATTNKITINGVEYTYLAGAEGTILKGVSPDPSGIVSGQVAIQSVTTTANMPSAGFNNDFIAVLGNAGANQLFVGSYNSKVIYISADGTTNNGGFLHFTNSNDLLAGDATSLAVSSFPTGMAPRDGKMYVSGGSGDWFEVVPNVPLPVSTLITGSYRAYVGTMINKLPGSGLTAALAHEFIKTVGNDIIYLSKDNQLKAVGTFKDIFGKDKFPTLSQAVYDELKEEDFTGGHIQAIQDFVYITAPVSGRHYLYQIRENVDANGIVTAERLWHPPFVEGLSRIEEIDGIVYGHSNQNPEIYQIWNTGQWHDDSPSGNLPYTCVQRMAYKHIGDKHGLRRQGLLHFDKVYFEGYIANGTNLFANILFDYQGASGLQNVIINSVQKPAIFFSGAQSIYLGSESLGGNPLGDGLVIEPDDQALLQKFRTINDISLSGINCFEYEIEVYSSDEDSRWEMLALGANAIEAGEQATFLRR
jgi:hypothetical protein